MESISLVLKSYFSNKIEDVSLLTDINEIVDAINNSFVYCKTEHSFNDCLSKTIIFQN